MAFTISPNMNLIIPTVGVEPGPTYATDIDNSLTIIDQHNHSAGSGVQITPSGLNLNADVTFLNNNATTLRSVRFSPQVSPLAASAPDLGAIYVSGSDLYYNDIVGNQVRITQSGSVAGSAGTITGLPSGTASASFAAGVFTFQASTLTPANIDGGSIVLRNNVASSAGLTLSPPNALPTDYSLVLPALPAQTNLMTLDTSGNMSSTTWNVAAESVTRAVGTTVGLLGVAISPVNGFYAPGPSGTASAVPNLTVSLTTSGRPVFVGLIGASGASQSYVSATTDSSGAALSVILFQANSGAQNYSMNVGSDLSSGQSVLYPPAAFSGVILLPAGVNTISVLGQCISGFPSNGLGVTGCALLAYEL